MFGKTRRAVLALLFTHPTERFYLRQIVRLTSEGLGPIQRELKALTQAGIVTRRKEGRQVYFQASNSSPIFPELKSLIIKTAGIADVLREAIEPLAHRIEFAFVYGSFAAGEERETSDVDVMVIGDVGTRGLVSAFRTAQRTLGREINPSVYPLNEFRDKLKSGHSFLKRVTVGPVIMLHGDENGLRNLGRKRKA